jgi:hypothetical protein
MLLRNESYSLVLKLYTFRESNEELECRHNQQIDLVPLRKENSAAGRLDTSNKLILFIQGKKYQLLTELR